MCHITLLLAWRIILLDIINEKWHFVVLIFIARMTDDVKDI